MKIAITHTRYSFVGGVEKYLFSLVKRLLNEGHEVHYFCHFWEAEADSRIQFHKISNIFKPFRALKVWSFDRWSRAAIEAGDYDLVHGFTKTGKQDIYTDGSGCLKAYQEYSLKEGQSSPFSPWVASLKKLSLHQRIVEKLERERFTRGHFRRILAMSKFAQRQICRRYDVTEDEVKVIYNGVDFDDFNPTGREGLRAEFRQRLNYSDKEVVALIVGNDYRRKGVETLIQATKLIKEAGGLPDGRQFRVAIVGKEKQKYEMRLYDLAQKLALHRDVRFFGPQRNIAEWHVLSDLHVLPTRFDIFGNVILEAMAMGRPTIVSSMAGAAEVVKEGETGLILTDPKDAKALKELIMELACSKQNLLEKGENAKREAQWYSWDRHFKQILQFYQEVKAEKNGEVVAATTFGKPSGAQKEGGRELRALRLKAQR